MAAPTVIVITDASLKLAADAASLPTASATFSCQVSSAAINATPNLQTVPATFCSPQSQVPAATGYELAVTWLQDWTAAAGGLSGYAFLHDTEEQAFELKLNVDDTEPIATGTLRLVAGAYGGDAGVPLPATATWPILGKPTITTPTAAAADATD